MRQLLLEGILTLPSYKAFHDVIGDDAIIADNMFKALWQNYLKDKGSISLPYWADKFSTAENFNIVLKSLSESGWITSHSIPARNWAEANLNESKLLKYCTIDELESIRASKKFLHYTLKESESSKTRATKLNGRVQDTGLVREGAAKAGNTCFSYDKKYMELYKDTIQSELTKSMDKIITLITALGGSVRNDRSSYDTISVAVMDYYLNSSETYTRGHSYNDSRGRAISESLSKIGNPISNKTFRALLVIE